MGLALEREEIADFDYMDVEVDEVWSDVDEDAEAILATAAREASASRCTQC